jgi:multidrug efflux pump subunit AcrB
MAHKTDTELIATTHNTARFFTEHRQISVVVLAGVFIWGWFGYTHMPKRKDPDIPVRVAVAMCAWPGVNAQQVEQLVTRPIEETIAQNKNIHPGTASDFGIESTSLPGLSIVTVQLAENVQDTKTQFSDINLKLTGLNARLPQGAGPIQFQSDFGDTAALMLTVASPPADEVEIALRAHDVERAIRSTRPRGHSAEPRVSLVFCFPQSVSADAVRRGFVLFARVAEGDRVIRDIRFFEGAGFIGLDAGSDYDDEKLLAYVHDYIRLHLSQADIHPDAWQPAVIRNPEDAQSRLAAVAGEKYSYRELDDFTDLISRTLLGIPQASKSQRAGVLNQTIYLDYSQERLASYGFQPSNLRNLLYARNIALPGGQLDLGQKNLIIDPSGQFDSVKAIGDVIVGASADGSPVYLRDLVDISRGYQSPASYLNYYTWCDSAGQWHRSRAITLAIFMKSGEQIQAFGQNIDQKLEDLRKILPRDLIMARTSDQPRQVREKLDIFMDALYEAIVLVILVSLIGFWEWRSALLMALAIPITLAMNFGVIYLLGIDIQQVSIATLIIALGLLVDDPVVAGDAVKRDMAEGHPPLIAAWLGPTKLAKAILYATITNIIAYLPFLLVTGNTGNFLYSLPIVMASALVCSRIVSMTFIPLLGYYLLRPSKKPEASIEERRQRGFTGFYYRLAGSAIRHRWPVFVGSLLFLAGGAVIGHQLKSSFFPDDVQYWSYLDIWLPNDASFTATNQAAQEAEQVIRQVGEQYGREHPGKDGKPRQILQSITTFVGGGGPRFWSSVTPQQQQRNYAQEIIEVTDKNVTPPLVNALQSALSRLVPGARIDARQLQTNPVNMPIQVMLSGQVDVTATDEVRDIRTLRSLANQVEAILRSSPFTARVRTDWDVESSGVKLEIDPDRANLAGVTNMDVADSSTAAMNGVTLTAFREGDKQIPVVARLRTQERSQLSDIQNLYVYSSTQAGVSVPLLEISSIRHTLETQRINRQEHFRVMSVAAFPVPGRLNSEALNPVLPALLEFQKTLPAGYKMQIGGEKAKQTEGFANLVEVMLVMIFGIYMALLVQFDNAIKPILVFAAAPYGAVGALVSLFIMGVPFGFMAFLGIISLVGVIISHVILLFDFIEEMRERGEPLEVALRDAGIQRLRPVMITVGATILALFPLALHGGPLWQPLCYAQVGGLAVATFITLLLVPVLYSIFVLDLRIVKWETPNHNAPSLGVEPSRGGGPTGRGSSL